MDDNFLFPEFFQAEKSNADMKDLDSWAFLYTSTATGKNSGIHFMMTTEDAKTFCKSPISCGVYLGAPWAYFFTTVKNFAFCHWGGNHSTSPQFGCVDLRKSSDNGKWDNKIAELGLKKYGKAEIKKILAPFGIDVLV